MPAKGFSNLPMPDEIHHMVKMEAARRKTTMQVVVEEAIVRCLEDIKTAPKCENCGHLPGNPLTPDSAVNRIAASVEEAGLIELIRANKDAERTIFGVAAAYHRGSTRKAKPPIKLGKPRRGSGGGGA